MSKHNSVPRYPRSEGAQTPLVGNPDGDRSNPIIATGTTVPTDSTSGYAPGCIFIHNDGGSADAVYINEGSASSCDFNRVPSVGTANTFVGAQTVSTSLSVTTADTLTVGGVIVPQEIIVPIELWPHASLKTRNLFYTVGIGWTVTGIVYEPDIAEGTGSVVCTVCKVTGNNVAVAATTPMCTAFDVTGTAGTPVTATLTGTGADLVLATTNKIGCIFTGGDEFLDTGRGMLYIKMKRS